MMYDTVPETYEQWHHCITVECGIELTGDYIAQRLKIWRDEKADETNRFRQIYGDTHWRAVIAWFERAKGSMG